MLGGEAVKTGEHELQRAGRWSWLRERLVAEQWVLILAGPGVGELKAREGEPRVSHVWVFPHTCRFLILHCQSRRSLCCAIETGCCPYPRVPSAFGRAVLTPYIPVTIPGPRASISKGQQPFQRALPSCSALQHWVGMAGCPQAAAESRGVGCLVLPPVESKLQGREAVLPTLLMESGFEM